LQSGCAVDLVLHPFFDSATSSFSYVLGNPATGCCAIVDPVLDYDPDAHTVSTRSADRVLQLIEVNGYRVEWILETHVHADHLSAAQYLKSRLVCAQLAIGAKVTSVQRHFAEAFAVDVDTDGRQFDRLLEDGERIPLGHACGRVLHTPGHTPACVSYVFDRFVFVGDTLFMPDYGTARCDFPGGDAGALYDSVQRLYALPDETVMLMCHDYAPGGRDHRYHVPVAEQRSGNRMLRADTARAEFAAARADRDRGLDAPRLLVPSVRANIAGGVLPGWDLEGHLKERMASKGEAA
jgi:glyoxylase-like metal-dependent hydrolase (beta-lactamase superfamily II)